MNQSVINQVYTSHSSSLQTEPLLLHLLPQFQTSSFNLKVLTGDHILRCCLPLASRTNYLHQQDMVSFKKAMLLLRCFLQWKNKKTTSNGLSLFNALTGRAEEASRHQEQNQMNIENQNELLSLESHHYQQERTLRHQRQPRSISNH